MRKQTQDDAKLKNTNVLFIISIIAGLFYHSGLYLLPVSVKMTGGPIQTKLMGWWRIFNLQQVIINKLPWQRIYTTILCSDLGLWIQHFSLSSNLTETVVIN